MTVVGVCFKSSKNANLRRLLSRKENRIENKRKVKRNVHSVLSTLIDAVFPKKSRDLHRRGQSFRPPQKRTGTRKNENCESGKHWKKKK
ncbi:hypothetical protein CEXT_539911 [Caerostris extrusa]|uniref:Uncharacterized protein n=1 Tax=Caerostris extrusa TaxID=172846 RepID=A0AAV4WHA6_CAEEX|nr:hypothetical protein CEXT_539911 [Caerostris extrusa]